MRDRDGGERQAGGVGVEREVCVWGGGTEREREREREREVKERAGWKRGSGGPKNT